MNDRTKNFLLAFGIGAGAFLLGRKVFAMSETYYRAPLPLSPHFGLIEFVRQHPDLVGYPLTQRMFDNVKRWATRIGEPLHLKFGRIGINSGGRPLDLHTSKPSVVTSAAGPVVTVPAGATMDDIAVAQGFHPVPHSDHHDFSGADIRLMDSDAKDPVARAKDYADAAIFLAKLPDTRQVILYYVTGPDGTKVPLDIHVAVQGPDSPRIQSPNYAFVMLNGVRFPGELAWQTSTPANV